MQINSYYKELVFKNSISFIFLLTFSNIVTNFCKTIENNKIDFFISPFFNGAD